MNHAQLLIKEKDRAAAGVGMQGGGPESVQRR
jgi:hypothetical protein